MEEAEMGDSTSFIVFLIYLLIIFLITKSGNKYRYKSLAMIFSFFLGFLGFQKFYLGEKKKGVLLMLFCWTFIPLLIGLIDFIELAMMNKDKFNYLYNWGKRLRPKLNKVFQTKKQPKVKANIQRTTYLNQQKQDYVDESIIEVNRRNLNLTIADNFEEDFSYPEIPYWRKTYIDSYAEMENATKEQKRFYNYFKDKVIKGEFVDIQGNTNYVYILYFDFLNEYDNHWDIDLLEKQFKFLAKNYPKINTHLVSKLKSILEQVNDTCSIEIIKDLNDENSCLDNDSTDLSTVELEPKLKLKKVFQTEEYSKKKPKNQRTTYLNRREKEYVDESIIDVNKQDIDLSIKGRFYGELSSPEIPFWSKIYVCSYDEIKNANKEQKQFYIYLKNKVINGEFVDIQGNTNYVYILYFDLLNEYDNHRDKDLLAKQFKLLGEICPKIKSYSLFKLKSILGQKNDTVSIEKEKDLNNKRLQFDNGYSDFDPNLGKLGTKFREKLQLTNKEIDWLNKFDFYENTFTSIEGCLIYTVKQYCKVLLKLEKRLQIDNLAEYIKKVIEEDLIRKSDYFPYFESNIYRYIFKKVENSVRESCQHSRKLTTDVLNNYSSRVQSNFDKKLGLYIYEIIESEKLNELSLDIHTQIELNFHNTARWRSEFSCLKEILRKGDKEYFINGVENLELVNKKNPNIKTVFYDASKFIAKYDRIQALKYYAKYIYYDLISKKIDHKELTKTAEKILFTSQEQINDFKQIIDDLIETKNIQVALAQISRIYILKRKRIRLDRSEIEEVEQKRKDTVELLNEYLVDDKEQSETEKSIEQEKVVELERISSEKNNSVFISPINMNPIQEELVKIIINNSFEIHQEEVNKYATANGIFKNQLIDSINEACETYLDGEALIEEEDENYIIEESYYKEIIK